MIDLSGVPPGSIVEVRWNNYVGDWTYWCTDPQYLRVHTSYPSTCSQLQGGTAIWMVDCGDPWPEYNWSSEDVAPVPSSFTGNIWLSWNYRGYFAHYWYLDNVRVTYAPPIYDAQVLGMLIDPEEVIAYGEEFNLGAIIRNIGNVEAEFTVELSIDGIVVETVSTGTMAPNTNKVVAFSPYSPPDFETHLGCVEAFVPPGEIDPTPDNNTACGNMTMLENPCNLALYFDGTIVNAITFNTNAVPPACWAMRSEAGGPFGSILSYHAYWMLGPGDPWFPWPDADPNDPVTPAVWEDLDGSGTPNDPPIWTAGYQIASDGIYPHWIYDIVDGLGIAATTGGDIFPGYIQDNLYPNPGAAGLAMDAGPQEPQTYYFRGSGSWLPFYTFYGNLAMKNCTRAADGEPDYDINDDYCSLEGNEMELTGVASGGALISMTFGDFLELCPDDVFNDDPWDGPGNCWIDRVEYISTDLHTYHKPDEYPIPAGNVMAVGGGGRLERGEYRRVTLGVQMPDHIQFGENDHGSKWYRGELTGKAVTVGPAPFFPPGTEWYAEDKFTLTVIGVHGEPGTVLPNSFVGEDGENGITLSWGDFNFGESFNLYRSDGTGNFVKLNDAPMPGNTSFVDENVVKGGTYEYKFGIVLEDGSEAVFGPMTARPGLRKATVASLMPSVPNPMKGEASIRYSIANDTDVTLKVYDMTGALVRTLVNESVTAGEYTVTWNGTNEVGSEVANGVYFYRLSSGDFTQSRKLVVMR
jgi:hypothetical protein